jgi:RHS repeat-associated protein
VWLRDTPMAMFTPDPANPSGEPLVYFIHSDHLNTPRVVVDRQNRVRWRWLAEPFGTSAPETNPSGLGVFTQNLRFPGQYADAESGLFYNYHRYYAAGGGGYTQSDPIGLAGGSLSTYGYVGGNPLGYIDPDGLQIASPVFACYRAARAGWRIGEALNPYVQPILATAIDAVLLDDPMLAAASPRPSPAKLSPAARRQFEYERMKDLCDAPPPPSDNECSTLSKQIDHAKEVIKLYEQFDAKYGITKHAQKTDSWKKRLENLSDEHNKKCTNSCRP